MPRFGNRAKITDPTETIRTQNEILLIMVPVTLIAGPLLLAGAFKLIGAVAWDFSHVAFTVWVIGAAVRFWASKVYEQGMSWKEVLMLFFWPLDLLVRVLFEYTGKQHFGNYAQWLNDGRGFRIPRTLSMIVIGGGLSLWAVYLLFDSLLVVPVLALEIIGLTALLYVIVGIAQFWIAQAWKEGFTRQELDDMMFWIAAS